LLNRDALDPDHVRGPLGRIKAEMAELNSTSVQRKELKLSIYWQMLGKVSSEK